MERGRMVAAIEVVLVVPLTLCLRVPDTVSIAAACPDTWTVSLMSPILISKSTASSDPTVKVTPFFVWLLNPSNATSTS
jgi:hypothetical protein